MYLSDKKNPTTTDHTLFVHPFDSKDVKGNVSLNEKSSCLLKGSVKFYLF